MMRRMSEGDERTLGVVEAITAVTLQCPHGSVVAAAEHALETIKKEGADVMATQAFLVLSAIQGWRGDRARQIHHSLQTFIDAHSRASRRNAAEAHETAHETGQETD